MSVHTVVIVEPNPHIATILHTNLQRLGCIGLARDPAGVEAQVNEGQVAMVVINVDMLVRDDRGLERPFWQWLAARPPLPVPILCYTGSNHQPLYTPPPGTMSVGSPQDFTDLATIIQRHCVHFSRHSGLRDALAGRCLPALEGSFAECSFDAILKLLQLNAHTGVLLIRQGLHTGIVAVEKGDVVHALVGSLEGHDAFCELFRWESARYLFLRGMLLGERTIREPIEGLLIEASRMGDEANDLMTTHSLQSYVQRVRGYTDQLPGKRLTPTDLKVLTLIDRYHVVADLLRHVDTSSVTALKSLRRLLGLKLVEVVPLEQPDSVAR